MVLNVHQPRPNRLFARICVVDPNMMPTMRVDKGAISFVMNGANIMCQGFTSKGGRIDTPLEAGEAVVSLFSPYVFFSLAIIASVPTNSCPSDVFAGRASDRALCGEPHASFFFCGEGECWRVQYPGIDSLRYRVYFYASPFPVQSVVEVPTRAMNYTRIFSSFNIEVLFLF